MKRLSNKFSEFEKLSKKTWIDRVQNDLKEKPMESFHSKIGDDFLLNPFIHCDDQIALNPKSTKTDNNWLANEQIDSSDYEEINLEILQGLNGGANSITVNIEKDWDLESFKKAFQNVFLSYIYINFQVKNDNISAEKFLTLFYDYLTNIGENTDEISGTFYQKNTISKIENINKFKNFKQIFIFENKAPNQKYHLADLLIDAEYFLANNLGKLDLNILVKSIVFEIKMSDSFYLNSAKIRALKILWETILKAYDLNYYIFIKAVIDGNNYSDENMAIISATNQAISAAIAGIDMLGIIPYKNEKDDPENTFSKRIFRNIHNILKIESHFTEVIDPINGSYIIDNLTKNICEEVWREFRFGTIKK